jgi:hypothetical protein
MNYYLLIAGDHYYPQAYTDNWIKCFKSYEEAKAQVTPKDIKRTITKGKRKGEEEIIFTKYLINDKEYEWYDIVNLQDWVY